MTAEAAATQTKTALKLTSAPEWTMTAEAAATETSVAQTATARAGVPRPPSRRILPQPLVDIPWIIRIEPQISNIDIMVDELVRLEVYVYDLSGDMDNSIADSGDHGVTFTWSDNGNAGIFAAPGNTRIVDYRAPSSPGSYAISIEAGPDGICASDHAMGGTPRDPERLACKAQIGVVVSAPLATPPPTPLPVNPAGVIPNAMVDNEGVEYPVFTPEDGGGFTNDDGVTVNAPPGAVPDGELIGIFVGPSDEPPPIVVDTGSPMTPGGGFFDVDGIQRNGSPPVDGIRLDEPVTVCLPLPDAWMASLSDVMLVATTPEGSMGLLSSMVRRERDRMVVCGNVSQLPATVSVARLGPGPSTAVPDLNPTGAVIPETGAASLPAAWVPWALLLGALVLVPVLALWFGKSRRGASRRAEPG